MDSPHEEQWREAREYGVRMAPVISVEKIPGITGFSDRELALFVATIVGHARWCGAGVSPECYAADKVAMQILAGETPDPSRLIWLRGWAQTDLSGMQARSVTHRCRYTRERCQQLEVPFCD